MEEIVKSMIPSLADSPTLLAVVTSLFSLFFGGFIFSMIRSFFDGNRRY